MTKKILIVDDDETFCEVLALALSKRDYDVSRAHQIKDVEATWLHTPMPWSTCDSVQNRA